ncbi:hypothetical protein KJ918_04535 [Patescibacteria group bacterium]|nr:hypothetical protein [Patescibacteria group bacterium]
MENRIKHLEMIQGIINRMASNSFLLKGWSVVLVSALFVLSAKETNVSFIYLAFFPALSFWELDGYFLWQERLYRKLYDKVRKMNESEIDFSMDTSTVNKEVKPWVCVTFSKTLRIFHGTIVGAIVIVMLIRILQRG